MKAQRSTANRNFAKIRKAIRRAEKAAKRSAKSDRRFALYRYLKAVYRGYCELEDQKLLRTLMRIPMISPGCTDLISPGIPR
ncbi:hypothetical protein [Bradyrhizobium icense]|nr:hypothetical protein [Bradyrhizobium icense]